MSTNTKLAEAIELAEEAMAYVPEYFANKHGMYRRMAALKEAAAHDAEQAARAVPAGFVQVPMCSDHAVWHAVNQARSESHKQGDAAFQQAFARAIWRQFNAMLAAAPTPPAPEAQQAVGQEQERAAFEAWAADYSTIPLKRDDDASLGFTGYTEMDQTMLWDAWQARAALARCGEPLTDEQIVAAANEAFDTTIDLDDETLVNKYGHGIYISRYLDFARAIERAHGIGATTGKEPGNV